MGHMMHIVVMSGATAGGGFALSLALASQALERGSPPGAARAGAAAPGRQLSDTGRKTSGSVVRWPQDAKGGNRDGHGGPLVLGTLGPVPVRPVCRAFDDHRANHDARMSDVGRLQARGSNSVVKQ